MIEIIWWDIYSKRKKLKAICPLIEGHLKKKIIMKLRWGKYSIYVKLQFESLTTLNIFQRISILQVIYSLLQFL